MWCDRRGMAVPDVDGESVASIFRWARARARVRERLRTTSATMTNDGDGVMGVEDDGEMMECVDR